MIERVGYVAQLCEYRLNKMNFPAFDIIFPNEETFCVDIALFKFIADLIPAGTSLLLALIIMFLFSCCKRCNRWCRSHRTMMKMQ